MWGFDAIEEELSNAPYSGAMLAYVIFSGMTSTRCHHSQHLLEDAAPRCQTNENEAIDPQML